MLRMNECSIAACSIALQTKIKNNKLTTNLINHKWACQRVMHSKLYEVTERRKYGYLFFGVIFLADADGDVTN